MKNLVYEWSFILGEKCTVNEYLFRSFFEVRDFTVTIILSIMLHSSMHPPRTPEPDHFSRMESTYCIQVGHNMLRCVLGLINSEY